MALQPPKNIRTLTHNSCINCVHLKHSEDDLSNHYRASYSSPYCERLGESELPCDIEELPITICDRHKRQKPETNQ